MRGITWMVIGVGSFASVAAGQERSFTTVIDSRSPIGGGTLADVRQVVLQDDHAVAALVRIGTGGTFPDAVTFSAIPGNGAVQVVAQAGQPRSDFGVGGGGGGGTFGEFYNLASAGGHVTFATSDVLSTGGRGLFRYTDDLVSPQRWTIHFAGDPISGAHATIDTGYGLPAYDVNGAGHVVFGAQTVAPTTPANEQLIARYVGGGLAPTRIHDASGGGIANFNLPNSYVSTRKVLTSGGHAVFVGDAGDGRRIYDVGPLASDVAQVRIERVLEGGAYEPMRLLAAAGDAVTGTTMFQAFKDRPAPVGGALPDDDWQKGAVLVKTPGSLVELGSFNTSLPPSNGAFSPQPSAVMSESGRVAALLPDETGGHVVYFDATSGASPTTIAGAGTSLGDGFVIKDLAVDAASVPMVNGRGTIVFDAVVARGDDINDERDALLAWTPGSDSPSIVVKTGDTITIGGEAETIDGLAPLYPFASELAYDGDVLKDGLNESDFLAFGVRYDHGAGAAVLLTQVPEAGALFGLIAMSGAVLARPRRARTQVPVRTSRGVVA